MNIHFFNPDPVLNAKYLDNVRARKMTLENMQMMSAALDRHGVDDCFKPLTKSGTPYRVSHSNHPSTLWVGDSRSNLLWLCDYTEALYERYKRSGGKAYTSVMPNLKRVRQGALKLPDKGLTEFVNCARHKELGIDYTWMEDVNKAYLNYINDRWDVDTIKLTWTGLQ